jgi:hypothetical protein
MYTTVNMSPPSSLVQFLERIKYLAASREESAVGKSCTKSCGAKEHHRECTGKVPLVTRRVWPDLVYERRNGLQVSACSSTTCYSQTRQFVDILSLPFQRLDSSNQHSKQPCLARLHADRVSSTGAYQASNTHDMIHAQNTHPPA